MLMSCFACSHLLPRQPTQYSPLQSYLNSAEERFRSCYVSQKLSFPFEEGRGEDRKQNGRPETAYKKAECLVATYGANLKFYSVLTLNECVIFVQFQECFS